VIYYRVVIFFGTFNFFYSQDEDSYLKWEGTDGLVRCIFCILV